jgi:hypothetical protein
VLKFNSGLKITTQYGVSLPFLSVLKHAESSFSALIVLSLGFFPMF